VNLPNSLTVARIVAAPLVGLLAFADSVPLRFGAFALFIAAAVTDYFDGMLARTRQEETNLGRLLDPLADKLLLLATFVPMFILQAPSDDLFAPLVRGLGEAFTMPFDTPVGPLPFPWWVLVIVLGREVFMTVFRQAAARRGVVIAAIGPAKVKTGFQWTWVGAAFWWFALATAIRTHDLDGVFWRYFAKFNGLVGLITMPVAVLLTLYSLWLYLARYGRIFGSTTKR
jgi:CDP-diacylglycerol---glycerol-3-phosphate 3-phosphatidyltransferase